MVELFASFSEEEEEDDDEEIGVGGCFDASTIAIMEDENNDGYGSCVPNMPIITTVDRMSVGNDDLIVLILGGGRITNSRWTSKDVKQGEREDAVMNSEVEKVYTLSW